MHMLFKCISAKCVFVFCLSLLFWQLVLHFGTTFDLYLVSLLLSPIRVSLHHTQQNRTKNREHRKEHNTRSTAQQQLSFLTVSVSLSVLMVFRVTWPRASNVYFGFGSAI